MKTKEKTPSKLPSKKFILAVLVALAIVIVSFFASQQSPLPKDTILKDKTGVSKENTYCLTQNDALHASYGKYAYSFGFVFLWSLSASRTMAVASVFLRVLGNFSQEPPWGRI